MITRSSVSEAYTWWTGHVFVGLGPKMARNSPLFFPLFFKYFLICFSTSIFFAFGPSPSGSKAETAAV